MISITNNFFSSIMMALFGASSMAFLTDFFINEMPSLPNISPDSLPIAIYSFLAAIITFFLKQSDSIKKMESHLADLVKASKDETQAHKDLIDVLKKQKDLAEEAGKHQKEIKETLQAAGRNRPETSQIRRVPTLED